MRPGNYEKAERCYCWTDSRQKRSFGDKSPTLRGKITVNAIPLLATPLTVITTFPVVAPEGTATSILVALQPEGLPLVPLNATLVPWDVPKLLPLIVIRFPA